jgi:hypothetical protein
MKRIVTFISALLLVGAAVAGEKVIQSSAKHMPKWVGGMENGFFIVSAQAESLEDAQQKAMTQLREQIISAVATRVHSATSITMHELSTNGDIVSLKEMKSQLSVEAADIPYLADISPSHAADFYWAKVRKEDKSTYHVYHVKYPFPNSKLRQLVDEYDQRQKLINDTLQGFAATNFSEFDDLDEMIQRYNQFKQFTSGLRESDSRHNICNTIRQSYDQMLAHNLHVETISSNRENTRVAIFYGPKQLTCALVPKVKSNCLTAIEIKNAISSSVIRYDFTTGCYEDEQNWLDITYTILGKKYTTRSYIK